MSGFMTRPAVGNDCDVTSFLEQRHKWSFLEKCHLRRMRVSLECPFSAKGFTLGGKRQRELKATNEYVSASSMRERSSSWCVCVHT